MDPALRPATSEDYGWIIAGVDEWWGRPVAASLPRLYLDHFCATSLVAECDASHVAFLIGFHSPSDCRASYIHFAGVDPRWRRLAIGRLLYERFFEAARAAGRSEVRAITSPLNAASIGFHRALGFEVSDPIDGYNGPGTSVVTFRRTL
jgi:ribosomal protein S18 acetylase RimI-like enzyme